ncbi:MAG: PAS domain S-box protein, partial [Bacteroidales bacterium]
MAINSYYNFLHNIPQGFFLLKLVYSNDSRPSDALVVDVNQSMLQLAGIPAEGIIGKSLRQLFPEMANDSFDWFSWLGEVNQKQKHSEIQRYIPFLEKWMNISATYAEQGHVALIINDITQRKQFLKQLVSISDDFLLANGSLIDYQKITNLMQEISGAAYVVINVYDENESHFVTKALSGHSKVIQKAFAMLGFNVIGKRWPHDPVREQKIRNQSITIFSHLKDLTGNVVPAGISNYLEKTFHIEEVVVAKITPGDHMIGDFTFFMTHGRPFRNHHEVEIFARQVGTFILARRSENALLKKEKKYREIFESIQDVYFETNQKGTILEISPSIEVLSRGQYTREYLIGKNLRHFYPDTEARERLINKLRQQQE